MRQCKPGVGCNAFSVMANVIDVSRLEIVTISEVIHEQSSCLLVRSAYLIWKCEATQQPDKKESIPS